MGTKECLAVGKLSFWRFLGYTLCCLEVIFSFVLLGMWGGQWALRGNFAFGQPSNWILWAFIAYVSRRLVVFLLLFVLLAGHGQASGFSLRALVDRIEGWPLPCQKSFMYIRYDAFWMA